MAHNSFMNGYTPGMKTAISVPNDVFEAAERLAAETHQSRSQLYSQAVREYVARHSADRITSSLNAVPGIESPPDEFVSEAARLILEQTEW